MSQIEPDRPKRILRSEMVKRGVSYAELSSRLEEAGSRLSEAALRNKVSRGAFTAEFFLQALAAMGVETLRLTE
jgi:hypothetical protein